MDSLHREGGTVPWKRGLTRRQALNPKPWSLNPKPWTLNPTRSPLIGRAGGGHRFGGVSKAASNPSQQVCDCTITHCD